jgi:hypothetical protein
VVSDQFPDFNQEVLQRAAQVNRIPQIYHQVMRGSLIFVGIMAILWFVNLPFPLIRWPISKTVPVLLFPTLMSMDYHYRKAISIAEQTEKLVQEAATSTEIDLGAENIQKAYQHLERVPVWFLEHDPKFFCAIFNCSWQFTPEEYQATQKNIQKIEAKIIQEQYAQKRLTEAEAALNSARQEYQKLQSGQRQVIAAWQAAIDLFDQIPKEGDINSHQYILQKEADYLGVQIDKDDVQSLLDEITSLRQEVLDSQTIINELTTTTNGR